MNGTSSSLVDIANCTSTSTVLPIDWLMVGMMLVVFIGGFVLAAVIIPRGRSP